MSEGRTISISFEADHNLTAKDVFPDGEPDEWDAETVMGMLRDDGKGDVVKGLREWMCTGATVTVTVTEPNPAWYGDAVMFKEHRPERWLRSTSSADGRG